MHWTVTLKVIGLFDRDIKLHCCKLKKSKDMGDLEVKEADPLENWHKGQDLAGKLFLGSDYADIIAKAKTAAVFGKLLDMGLDPEDLEAAINEVNNAD